MYWQLLIFVLKLIHPFFKVFLIFFIHRFDNLENFPFFLITSSSFESLFYSALKVFLLFFNHNFDNFEVLVHFSSIPKKLSQLLLLELSFFRSKYLSLFLISEFLPLPENPFFVSFRRSTFPFFIATPPRVPLFYCWNSSFSPHKGGFSRCCNFVYPTTSDPP